MPTTCCRHIRINGKRCGSVALRNKPFCYFHIGLAARHRTTLAAASSQLPASTLKLDFPPLEDRESIQVAISMLLSVLGQDRIEPRRAATMLYALQVASANSRHLNMEPFCAIDRAVSDEAGSDIAPDEDPIQRMELAAILESLENGEPEDDGPTPNDPDQDDPDDDL